MNVTSSSEPNVVVEEWQVVYVDGLGNAVIWSRCSDFDDAQRDLAVARREGWPGANIRTRVTWASAWKLITSPSEAESNA